MLLRSPPIPSFYLCKACVHKTLFEDYTTSEIGTTSKQRTKDPFPKCPLFGGSTVLQKQPNHYDCGLFSIANAMAICNVQSPKGLKYDRKVMRKHLAGCLEDKVFRHFPAS